MRLNCFLLPALILVGLPVFMVGKLHKDGALNLDTFPPKIEKEHLVIEPTYPTGEKH